MYLGLIAAGRDQLPRGELALEPQQHGTRLRHININRIQLLHRGQCRRLVGSDQRSLGDGRAPDAAPKSGTAAGYRSG